MKRQTIRARGRRALHGGFGLGVTVCFIALAMALVSVFWTPYDPTSIDAAARLTPPSPAHWLGTNHLGRDVLSMTMAGAQTSISVALFAVGIGVLIGAPLGLVASARGGLIDDVIMRAGDVVFAFPAVILAILFTAVIGPGALNAIIAIGVFNIPVFARLTRGAAAPLWNAGFVLAARSAGKTKAAIAIDHILPNIAHILIVQGTVQLSIGVLAEAALSYVGLGAQPPTPSWGRMLAESQTLIGAAPWLAIFPGLAIFTFALGINLVGDGLRRRFDPREWSPIP